MVITGASRGIGAATARLAAERGHDVCVNFRTNEAAADAVVADVRAAGRRAIAVQADVASEPDVVRLFETVDATVGVVAGLVNNAGILEGQTRVEHMDAARVSRVFATNVTGAFLCAREAVRRMSTQHGKSPAKGFASTACERASSTRGSTRAAVSRDALRDWALCSRWGGAARLPRLLAPFFGCSRTRLPTRQARSSTSPAADELSTHYSKRRALTSRTFKAMIIPAAPRLLPWPPDPTGMVEKRRSPKFW